MIKLISALLIFVCFSLIISCSSSEDIDKPNFLFILADDLGWTDPGFMGSRYHETPNLDHLASEGMVFTDAYAACPVCSPSRAAILSGKYPARLNLTDYIPGNRSYGPHKNQQLTCKPFDLQLGLEEITIAEALKEAGYVTMFAGKWHVSEDEAFYPLSQGFDINIGGNNTGHPAGGYFSPYKNPQLPDGHDGEYLTDRLTNEVIDFIEKNKDTTFFAYLSFYTVHLPMQGKADKVEKYTNKLSSMNFVGDEFTMTGNTYFKHHQNMPHFAAMVESMDENIGRLMKKLKDTGIEDNTVVIFTSDNGGMASSNVTHNIPTSNDPLRAGKGYLYEGGIREPLIIKWPGNIKEGNFNDTPLSGTDFYPTILDLAGIDLKPDQHMDGISFKPLFINDELDMRPIFWHYPHYSGGLGGRPSGAVRLGDFKLIEFYEDMHIELYNLRDDLSEKNDLTAEMPEKAAELKNLLHQWRIDVNAQMPYPNPYFENRTNPDVLLSADYHTIRSSFGNSFMKFEVEKKGRVAFLGGSITYNGGWRDSICQYLENRFPDTEFDFIAAGIPSMGTPSAAFRFERDVLKNGPVDLLFEEAAVNDAAIGHSTQEQIRAMEGIIRHARISNPYIDIIMMHFVDPEKMKLYRNGDIPGVIQNHEKVAEQYRISTINLAKEVTERIDNAEFTWEGDFRNLHPSPFGQGVYARSMICFLDSCWNKPENQNLMLEKHFLPSYLDEFAYDNGVLISANELSPGEDWLLDENWKPEDGKGTRDDFVNVPMLICKQPGKILDLPFSGNVVGIAVAAGPDSGIIEYKIDGTKWQRLDLFTKHSGGLHLPRYYTLASGLEKKDHVLRIRLAEERNERSTGTVCRIRYLFINQ